MTDSPNPGRPAPAPDDGYIPQVGDQVRRPDWDPPVSPLRVTAVGVASFLATESNGGGREDSWPLDGDWVKVVQPPPIADTWRVLTVNGHALASRPTRDRAIETATRYGSGVDPAAALLHIWTDDDGTYRSTIEPLDR